jgi:hypothetical protein
MNKKSRLSLLGVKITRVTRFLERLEKDLFLGMFDILCNLKTTVKLGYYVQLGTGHFCLL